MNTNPGKQKRSGRARLLQKMRKLSDGRVNDAVKLAFLDSGLDRERLEEIDRLELGALAEFKRSGNGTVEIKLVDRMAALEKLIAISETEEEKAEQFFQALEQQAVRRVEGKTAVGDSGRGDR